MCFTPRWSNDFRLSYFLSGASETAPEEQTAPDALG